MINSNPSFLEKFGKAVGSVLFAGLVALYAFLSGDNHVDNEEKVQVAIAVVGAVGTFLVPLAPEWRWGKTLVNALMAVLLMLATVILGGLDSNEWILLLLALGGALGVGVLPAVSQGGVAADWGSDDHTRHDVGV